jgi:hypothetical protein
MNALYHAHSGLRYLVLLLGLVALAAFAYGLVARRPVPAGRAIMGAFVGTLHLQIILGLVLVLGGIWYGALMGHLTLMLVAGAVATVALVRARRAPDERGALTIRLVGVVVALLCVVGGILAIGRSLLGSGAPTSVG